MEELVDRKSSTIGTSGEVILLCSWFDEKVDTIYSRCKDPFP